MGTVFARVLIACVFCAMALLVAPWTSADAYDAAALVLECSGSMTPHLQPYSEIPVSTAVKLGPGARLVFLDYQSCLQVTLSGGELKFGPDGYAAKGGKQFSKRVPCPTRFTLTDPGEVAGAHLRGDDGEAQSITTRPSFVLVAGRTQDFQSCKLFRDHQEVITAPLMNGACELPPNAKPLESGSDYELLLVPKSPALRPVRLDLVTSMPSSDSGKSLFLIEVP